jgi:hypothetical protein
MSISYSGLTNYGKSSLPSVDSWGYNMNILKDPPRSIQTRRIDKVGQTSEITSMIDDAENRACEAINVYARGINPMVSVDYSNAGNNGGQRSGTIGSGNITNGNVSLNFGQGQAYLPYRIMRDGAFRPPVLRQEDLLPLSRLPRVWTTAFTKPGFVDFSKKMKTCGTAETTKEVKTKLLKASVRPTAVYKIETPISEPFEVKYMIQPTLKKSYTTALKSTDRTTQNVLNPTKQINNDMMHPCATTNLQDIRYIDNNEFNPDRYLQDTNAHEVNTNLNENRYIDNNEFNPDRYLQDTNVHEVNTNVGAHIQLSSLEDILDLSNVKTKDAMNIDYITPISGYDKIDYIHSDIELERTIPEYSTYTNIKHDQYKRLEHEYIKKYERNTPLTEMAINPGRRGEGNISTREYQLSDKLHFGGFDGRGVMPTQNRVQQIPENYESDKSKMNKKVEQLFSRYRN